MGSMRRSRNRNATRADARYQMPDADRPNHTKTTKDYTLSSQLNHSSLNHSHLNHLIILHTVRDLPASCCCWQCITPSSSKCIAISSQSPSHDHMDDFAFSINIASRPWHGMIGYSNEKVCLFTHAARSQNRRPFAETPPVRRNIIIFGMFISRTLLISSLYPWESFNREQTRAQSQIAFIS